MAMYGVRCTMYDVMGDVVFKVYDIRCNLCKMLSARFEALYALLPDTSYINLVHRTP